MTNFIFIIAISIALLLVLWLAARRGASPVMDRGDLAGPAECLVQLPARALLDRFLSAEDLEYAATLNSPTLLRMVVRERRRLTAAWLRQTCREAGRLFRVHVRMARQAEGLRPLAELKLVLAVGTFFFVYAVMMCAVAFYGPLQTRSFLASLQRLANVLSRLGGRIADSVSPGLVPQLEGRGAR